MANGDGFTVKEVMVEIKDELKAFRTKYDKDQEKRDDEIAKRPTRTELYGSVTVLGAIAGVLLAALGM